MLLVGVNIPRPNSVQVPSELDSDCRPLHIAGPGRVELATWYCNRGHVTPLVILFHGYSSDKSSLMGEARLLLELGASVQLVDLRGSGGSSEAYTTIGVRESEDVAAAANYAKNHLSHTSTILFGRSMGSAAVLRALHVHAIVPDAIILEAVFDTMLNTVRNRFSAMGVPSFPSAHLLIFWAGRHWDFDGFTHNPVDYALSVNCPALFMHGTDDPRATILEGRRVFAAVPGPKEFVEFEALGHESYASKYPDEWQAAVSNLLWKAENQQVRILESSQLGR